MPQYNQHIQQAKQNMLFLEYVNSNGNAFYDWQVTTCFYVAVHLVNAHLSLHHMQYRKHVDVKDALNPLSKKSSATALPNNEYLAYTKLQSLSRRSRYLVNEKDGNLATDTAFLTFEVHLSKALKHLNTLLFYFSDKYNFEVDKININCAGVTKENLFFCK